MITHKHLHKTIDKRKRRNLIQSYTPGLRRKKCTFKTYWLNNIGGDE